MYPINIQLIRINIARFIITLILCTLSAHILFADNGKQVDCYIKEAEYYQRKADNYRREVQYDLKKAERYERDMAYHTKKGNTDWAKDFQRKASKAMEDYRTQMRYAANADDKAADYLHKASNILRK